MVWLLSSLPLIVAELVHVGRGTSETTFELRFGALQALINFQQFTPIGIVKMIEGPLFKKRV